MLVSYLAARKITLPFKNMEELSNNPQFKLILWYESAPEDLLKYSGIPAFKNAYERNVLPYKKEYYGHLKEIKHILDLNQEKNVALLSSIWTLK